MTEPTHHDGLTHIVSKENDAWARAVLETQADRPVEQRIKVKAICGYEYTPSRDPANFPLCPKCDAVAKRDRIDVSGKHR